MSNVVNQIKPQAKRVDQKLKSKILREILLPNSSIPKIAKNYDLSSTTLYGWRLDHIKKLSKDLRNTEGLSETSKNNFIELVSEDNVDQRDDLLSSKILPSVSVSKNSPTRLSEISITLNNNISLSLKGNINSFTLIKIINSLEEEVC